MLFGEDVVDAEIMGIKAGRSTRGHRFHYNQTIDINCAQDYVAQLKSPAYVICDMNERRALIERQVNAEADKLGGVAVIDEDLLNEVTALVEWPVALAGRFEERFLEVPSEALISSMKEHQKYFHVVNDNGDLMPHFITVSNIISKDPAQVIDGNERVIRPRLADAAFFFETDKKTSLLKQRERLHSIVFQAKLGTLFAKTERVSNLAQAIAKTIGANQENAQRAGILCKSDLITDMVSEFDKMQGIAGYYYALNDGEAEEVALALNEQYLPRFAGDILPTSECGVVLALADRLDTLSGIFGIGQMPTGSKDPFALRRASVAVLRLIVEKELDVDLRELLELAKSQHTDLSAGDTLVETVLNYMIERFRAVYEDANIPAEVFMAVSAKALTRPLDINQRVLAVHNFSQLPEAQSLAAANKRVSNILAKLGDQAIPDLNNDLLQEPAEQALAKAVAEKAKHVAPLFAAANYSDALAQLADLRDTVDTFFDDVMVMADDEALRNNRLALLSQLRALFLEVADISLLVPAKK
jgi:glycyl-tRNA synthetase beta chain